MNVKRRPRGFQSLNTELIKRFTELEKRIEKLEKHSLEDTLTLIEILSNVAYFGNLKMEKCEHAKQGQCSLFLIRNDAKGKIPMVTDCRIDDCNREVGHCHLEVSKVTCAFCPVLPLLTHAQTL